MTDFIIIENDAGLSVAEVGANETPDQVALANGGLLVDEGPYHSFEDAYDAMQLLPQSPEDELSD